MPPRKYRSSRGRGGGGNVSAETVGSTEDSQTQGEQASALEPFTLTTLTETLGTEDPIVEAPLIETPPTFYTTTPPQHEDDDSLLSPNTSPARAPTETPAPTPVRPPVQRLESLGLSGRGAYGTRAGVGGRVMAGKFKPRARAMRSQVEKEQDQHDAEEQRRELGMETQQERDMNSSGRMQGISQSGSRNWERGVMRGRGRGRGEVMGRGRMDRNNKAPREATGLFGVAPAASGKLFHMRVVNWMHVLIHDPLAKKPTNAPARVSNLRALPADDRMDIDDDVQSATSSLNAGSSRLNTKSVKLNISPQSTRVKEDPEISIVSTANNTAESDHDTQSAQVKVEVPEPIYPEEQEEGSRPAPRVDIEHINLITDDEDDYSDAGYGSRNKGKGRSIQSKGGLKPVRLQREEHKERVTLVNTEPAAVTLTHNAEEPTEYQLYVSTDDEEDNQIEISRSSEKWSGVWRDDEVEVKHDPEASDAMDLDVTTDPNTLTEISQVSTGQINNEIDSTSAALIDKEKKKKRHRKPKDKQPVLQTEEDRAEYVRHLEDLRILAEELGGVQINSTKENDNGTVDLGESTTAQGRLKDLEGRLYLFQFPPALPMLVNKVKKEEATDDGTNLMEVEAGPSNATEAIDLTKPDPEELIPYEVPHGTFYIPAELVAEEGSVGKVIVRKSGKVQLNWGGVLLELGRGIQSDHLTTTMIVDDGGPSDASAKSIGTATGMGKVMGTFVLKPDFEAMGLM
jgi:DNA-directed RNA polymerase III subunit RPC4